MDPRTTLHGGPFGRHRVYWYTSNWYGHCGACGRVLWAQRWHVTFNLLEYHVSEHV